MYKRQPPSRAIQEIDGLKEVTGVVTRARQETIIEKDGNTWWYPPSFSVLTTDDKKYCIATSFVPDITKFSFVRLIVDAEVRSGEKQSLRGVITEKLTIDDAMSAIHKEFGSLDEFFKNIDKKF